jgi:excinuclease UvrABC nuclease subunit
MRLKVSLENITFTVSPESGVYRFLDSNLNILYIGSTYDFKKRLCEHKEWIRALCKSDDLKHIDLFPCSTNEMLDIEKKNIDFFKPKFNQRLNNKKITFYAYNTLPNKIKSVAAEYDMSMSAFCNQLIEFGLQNHKQILKF